MSVLSDEQVIVFGITEPLRHLHHRSAPRNLAVHSNMGCSIDLGDSRHCLT